ncbi:MAG: hypothetical protein M1823_005983 [Watsoniomyces obsoletus]|nr:MAG: hypothetical protein M1823_005983 [Watsoniomyces obsoletus]
MSLILWLFLSLVSAQATDSSLPTVDLGYTVQQASEFNSTGQYYNFTNIRYAEAPVDQLRFAAPAPPKSSHRQDDPQTGRVCPQAHPAWEVSAAMFLPKYLTGSDAAVSPVQPSTVLTQDGRETEDCLFLDVMAPKDVFDQRQHGSGAPVLVRIHGGGYVYGSKTDMNPAGLIERGRNTTAGGIVFVAINYRLGAFGWLGGPTVQSSGVANAGLLDQRLALDWVQNNIGLFGGDPNRVTVMGQSSGGGSIMHHITSYGGSQPVPFQQAIVQSPGYVPVANPLRPEFLARQFLSFLKVGSIDEARQLPYESLAGVSALMVALSRYGDYTFGPVVDGGYVPDVPNRLLLSGNFARDLRVLVSHVPNEGLIPTPEQAKDESYFDSSLTSVFPSIRPEVASYISQELYPPSYDGSQGYTDPLQRLALLISEAFYSCNSLYLGRAFGSKAFGYIFSLPPGLHAVDVPYTFYTGLEPSGEQGSDPPASLIELSLSYGRVAVPELAIALQKYITEFVASGVPGGYKLPPFPTYGEDSQVLDISVVGITEEKDTSDNARCEWWQKGGFL